MRTGRICSLILASCAALAASACLPDGSSGSGSGSAGSGGQAGMHQSCDVEFDAIAVEGHRQVGGSAWATCQDGHLPTRHHMVLKMQFQRLADRGTSHWLDVASADSDQIPRDALTKAGHPVTVIVHTPCQIGVFRMTVTVNGAMPDTGDWIPYTRTSDTYTVSSSAKCDR